MAETPLYRFNWVDGLALILLIRMGYVGFRAGLETELVKLAALTAGFFVGFRYYQGVGDVVARRTFLGLEWAAVLALTALVVVGYLVGTRLLRFLGNVVTVSFQDRVQPWGGLVFGFFRGALVASVILVVCQQLPSPYLQASITEHAWMGRAISGMAPAVYDGLSAVAGRLRQVAG